MDRIVNATFNLLSKQTENVSTKAVHEVSILGELHELSQSISSSLSAPWRYFSFANMCFKPSIVGKW